jgi:hypothetical protein
MGIGDGVLVDKREWWKNHESKLPREWELTHQDDDKHLCFSVQSLIENLAGSGAIVADLVIVLKTVRSMAYLHAKIAIRNAIQQVLAPSKGKNGHLTHWHHWYRHNKRLVS